MSLVNSTNINQNKNLIKQKYKKNEMKPSAKSPLKGCSGSGSLTSAIKDCITWSVLVAGFQLSALIIGKQTWPFSSIFGWYIFVLNEIFGGLNGYSAIGTIFLLT